jgi:superfamily II DNA helicase RecQ
MRLAAERLLRAKGRGARADVLLKVETLAPELMAIVEYRFGEAALKELRHLESVEAYASTSGGCRRQHLLSYFDDEAAPSVAPCDGCDVCRGRKKPLLSRLLERGFSS